MKLHHSAYQITLGNSKLMQLFCEYLGAKIIWEGHDQGREVLMDFGTYVIQFSEINEDPINSQNKQETHLAFVSENIHGDLIKITDWFKERDVEIRVGQWSEREIWIDCPKIFINFAIEIFHSNVLV